MDGVGVFGGEVLERALEGPVRLVEEEPVGARLVPKTERVDQCHLHHRAWVAAWVARHDDAELAWVGAVLDQLAVGLVDQLAAVATKRERWPMAAAACMRCTAQAVFPLPVAATRRTRLRPDMLMDRGDSRLLVGTEMDGHSREERRGGEKGTEERTPSNLRSR